MSLTQKFKDSVSGGAINITSLCIGTRYPVIHCDRIGMKYGDAVRLTIREDDDDNMLRGFLPRHYGSAISEEYTTAINSRKIQYYLTYKGKKCFLRSPYATHGCLIHGASLLQNSANMRIMGNAFNGGKEFYYTD